MFALTGWRFDRTWALVAAGFAVFAVSRQRLPVPDRASARYVEGGPLDVGWPAALVLIACSAWQPPTKLEGVRTESWQALTLPTFFAVVGLGLLVYDHFDRINVVALVLAAATIARRDRPRSAHVPRARPAARARAAKRRSPTR